MGISRFSSPMTSLLEVAHEGRHPIHMFSAPGGSPPTLPMRHLGTPARMGLSRGRCPVSRFPWILKSCKLFRFATHRGNSPDSRLYSSRNPSREEMPPSSDGIGPVRLFSPRYSIPRLERFASWGGIDPVRLLLWRFSCVRLERFASWGGIDPVRLFPCKVSSWRLERFASWVGIDPVRLLCWTSRRCKAVRFPNSVGRLPFSFPEMEGRIFERNPILVTRGGVPATVIPCQFDTAVVAFQFSVIVPRKVSFAAQRASQSATSPVLVVGLGTVVPFRHWVNVVCPETSNNNRPETRRSANSIAAAVAAIPHRMGCPDQGG